MEANGYDYAPMDFQTRMQEARDTARKELDRAAYLGARIVRKRPPVQALYSVAEAAQLLGVSRARVRQLCASGRLGAVQKRTGRREYRIPATRQPDGSFRIVITAGTRGPALTSPTGLIVKPIVPF
jgi:excisionase family DNA binding protein